MKMKVILKLFSKWYTHPFKSLKISSIKSTETKTKYRVIFKISYSFQVKIQVE